MKRKLVICYRIFTLIFHEFLMCIGWIFTRLQHTLSFTYRSSRWDINMEIGGKNEDILFPEKGGPLLTVETEVNWGLKSTNERGRSLVGSLGLSCWYKMFLFCFGCSVDQVQIFLPSPFTILIPLSTSLSKLGRLSFSMCSFIEKKSIWIFQHWQN